MSIFRLSGLVLCLLAFAVPASLEAAAPDNNVEWDGISHHPWQDRRPLCPVGQEAFAVKLVARQNDLTAVRVRFTDGTSSWVNASVEGTRGPYDIWSASLPASVTATPNYYFELTDGTDVDYLSVSGLSDGVPVDGGFALDFATLDHAPVGATPTSSGGAVFKVWAPTRTAVHVRGEFNAWGLGNPMTQVGEHFIAEVGSVAPRAQYKYYFNNSVWNTDARARAINATGNSNAYVEDPFGYAWTVEDFATPAFDELVIYQLHLGTFSGRNDPVGTTAHPGGFLDAAARVGHLVELGVNAVLLNPPHEFPGDESAGYNPQSQWAPEWVYGTPNDFKFMVDTFHQNGIAVLVDIVWNHFTVSDNFMWNYDGSQTYFDSPHVDTPWGAQADFDEPAVRDYYVHSAHVWLEEYKIDGFRMDATDFMNISSHAASGWSLMQRLNDEVDRRWENKIVIAEQLPDDAGVTTPTSSGGAGFDAQYHDEFADRLRDEVFDSLGGDPEMWKIQNIVNGSGAFISNSRAVNYMELHDEAWPTSGGQRLAKSLDPSFPHDNLGARARSQLSQGLVLLAPGIPAFLMGAEWLEDTDFGTGSGNRIDWSKKTTYASFYQFFRDLVAMRTDNPALGADAFHDIFHLNEFANTIAFRRQAGEDDLVVVANFDNAGYTNYRIGLPQGGEWVEALNSDAAAYGGNGADNPGTLTADGIPYDGYGHSLALTLPATGILVLKKAAAVGVADEPREPAGLQLLRVFPNPTAGRVSLAFELEAGQRVQAQVIDARGRVIATLTDGPRSAGEHRLTWNGRTAAGEPAAPGIYFLHLRAGGERAARKITRLR